MKNIHYINLLLVLVCIAILSITIYGGLYKKEHFTNEDTHKFQSQLIEGIKNGKIDRELIAKNIKEKKISKEDIDSIISIVAKETTNSKKI